MFESTLPRQSAKDSYPGVPSTPSVIEGERDPRSNGIGWRSFPSDDTKWVRHPL